MIHITEEEAVTMIDRYFTSLGKDVMQRAGTAEKEAAARDKELAAGMRALWIERADGAEPFIGGDD